MEWPLFSALWSEHCSYKSSKVHLKKLFSQSPRVLESFGENAGVIDLGDGERIAFKMESHNHPSYIEPTQGAATGVGGILRDIFTMGARPIALANYLCFGKPHSNRMSHLVAGVVRGIGSYGNCVGVPTLTGQTESHSSYDKNILVNALALGLFRPGDPIFTSKASGVGNLVVYVGAKTGRDGVHGASMASGSFDENSESQRPTVQIGDPFFEKLLIEGCLEVMAANLVVAIQDMGAAGLTSSCFEMASKGGVGFTLHLDRVPLRQDSMTPEEILLSESQERMLLICEPQNIQKLCAIFKKWSLDAVVIGEISDEKTIHLFWKGEELCNIDPFHLVDGAPVYERPYRPWTPKNRLSSKEKLKDYHKELIQGETTKHLLLSILSGEKGASREWIYKQYDQRVGGATIRDCSESIGVVRLPDSGRALGLVLGCRPYMMRFDACEGGKDAVAYPAIELAAKGFEPLALTDCLNFGNPEKVEIMSEFVASLESLSSMCESLQMPIISGNVSFYNETLDKNITPTPTVGMVGLRPDAHSPPSFFQYHGDEIYLVSSRQLQTSGLISEVKREAVMAYGDIQTSQTTSFVWSLVRLTREVPIQSSRIVGKFGLAYALSRMSTLDLGCHIPKDKDWFLESLYEVILCIHPSDKIPFSLLTDKLDLNVEYLGSVEPSQLRLGECHISCDQIQKSYFTEYDSFYQ